MTDNHWRSMFEQPGRNGGRSIGGVPPTLPREKPDDETPAIDLAEYKPWILQRGRSRPAMMLHLRRFEPRSTHWMGWVLAYPSLIAAEYIGERMLSLDFGMRQFVIEGEGLEALARCLQEGIVATICEYSAQVWPARNGGPNISAIRHISRGN